EALAPGEGGLIAEHGTGLPDDFAGAQVAFDSQQRSEAELATDGAANLTRDADGGALPLAALLLFVAGFAAVSRLAQVTLRHPHRLDALAVGEGHQVTHGAILREE